MGGFLNDETVIDQMSGNAGNFFITTPFPLGKLLGAERFNKQYIWDRREPYPFRSFELAANCSESFIDVKTNGSSQDRDLTFEEAKAYVLSRAHQFLSSLHLSRVKNCMQSAGIKPNGENVLYYTFIMDSFNHNYGALNEMTMERAAAMYAGAVAMIQVLRETGLDEEYAFFISSDHGGQFFLDEDELCNHGCLMDQGNEAIFYVYSKGEGPRPNDVWINTEDIGAIIPQYVIGAGVPGSATGNAMPMFKTVKYEYMALRSKEIQLLSHLNYLDPAHFRDLALVMGIDVSNVDLTDDVLKQYIAAYPEHLTALQAHVSSLQTPWLAYLALTVLILTFSYFILRPVLLSMDLNRRDWVSIGLLFAEIVAVAVRNNGLGRVEKMVWWPIVGIQVGFLAAGLMYASDEFMDKNKRLANVRRLLNIPAVLFRALRTASISPLSQLSLTDISAAVITLNVTLLLTDEFGNVFTRIGELLYSFHYLVIVLFVLYDSQRQAKEGYKLLWMLARYCSLVLLGLSWYYEWVTDYSMSDQTEEMMAVIHIFFVSALLSLLLILTAVPSSERGRLIVYPVFVIYFFIASQQQRSHLLFIFIPTMEVLSSLARAQDSLYLYCLLASQGSVIYLINRGSYGFDISLRAGNHSWGTYPDEFPIFTGIIFGFHKMSWYHMVGAYIYRSLQWPKSSKGLKFLELLACRGLAVLAVFMVGFYANPANTLSVFMWAMAQSSTMLFLHTVLIVSFNS